MFKGSTAIAHIPLLTIQQPVLPAWVLSTRPFKSSCQLPFQIYFLFLESLFTEGNIMQTQQICTSEYQMLSSLPISTRIQAPPLLLNRILFIPQDWFDLFKHWYLKERIMLGCQHFSEIDSHNLFKHFSSTCCKKFIVRSYETDVGA